MSDRLDAKAALTLRKGPLYPLDRLAGRTPDVVKRKFLSIPDIYIYIYNIKQNIISLKAVYPSDTKTKGTFSLELERSLHFS
jgi:hypothetical protein